MGEGAIAPLLEDAHAALPGGAFSKPERYVTAKGLAGLVMRGAFVPDGASGVYRRIHVVLVDGAARARATTS